MRQILIAVILAACMHSVAADSEISPEPSVQEMKYAAELRKLGLDEFADMVIERIPDEKNKAVILAKFQAFIHRNLKNEQKIEEHIKKQAGDDAELYWMLKIRLADAYWAWGKQGKSLEIYEEFMQFYQKLMERSKEP